MIRAHPPRVPVLAAVAAAMVLVGVSYSLFLRHTWSPEGWQLVADKVLHDLMPSLFLIYWWFGVPRGGVRRTDITRWCIYPIGYFGYALARGALIGRYPYPFIDVNALGYGRVLVSAAGLLAGFVLIAWLLVATGERKQHRRVAF